VAKVDIAPFFFFFPLLHTLYYIFLNNSQIIKKHNLIILGKGCLAVLSGSIGGRSRDCRLHLGLGAVLQQVFLAVLGAVGLDVACFR